MSDDIAREAEKVRAGDAKAAADRKRAAQEAAEYDARISLRERDARAEMVRDSLGPALGGLGVGVIVVLVIGAMVAIDFAGQRHGEISTWVLVVESVVALAAMLGSTIAIPRLVARWRLSHLGRIGHGFDEWAYRKLLSDKRSKGEVVITLGFAIELDPKRGHQVADALRGWVPELARTSWDGTCVRAHSGPLDGNVSGSFVDGRWVSDWTNIRFHRVVMHVARRALPKLDATAPVVRFDVEIKGGVEAWDAR